MYANYNEMTKMLNLSKTVETSILRVLLKQYRPPTDPNEFKSATIISVYFSINNS